jgi:cytochrome c
VRKFLVFVLATISLWTACDPARPNRIAQVRNMTGGDPNRGEEKIRQYGCNTCHTIPGVTGAQGLVGPPLVHWSKRVYIAGELPNTPENLRRWIQHPPQVEPKTAMPDMGVNEQDSRDISAYLYSLN